MPVYGIKNLDRRIERLKNTLAKTIPARIGQAAENHFRESFKKGGFTDRTFVKWPARKKPPMDKRGKVRKHTVLFQTGMLRNSVRLLPNPSWNNIQVVAGGPHVPYARAHNEGTVINKSVSVRAHGRRAHPARTRSGKRIMRKEANVGAYTRHMNTVIRKRQFMGESYVLGVKMRAIILKSIAETLTR